MFAGAGSGSRLGLDTERSTQIYAARERGELQPLAASLPSSDLAPDTDRQKYVIHLIHTVRIQTI